MGYAVIKQSCRFDEESHCALKAADPVLAGIIDCAGPYKIQYSDPVFHTLARSIVYQQLNGKAASTIFGRLLEVAVLDPLTPDSILRLRPAKMRAVDFRSRNSPMSGSWLA